MSLMMPGKLRVVMTGAESTGKSTLARLLASEYGAPLIEEQVRIFVERYQRVPTDPDVWLIVDQFLRSCEYANQHPSPIVILDTDLISTLIYHRWYFGYAPKTLTRLSKLYQGDLYFLAEDDIPWEKDGLHRDGVQNRQLLQEEFRTELSHRSIPFIPLFGSVDDRMRTARAHIDFKISAMSTNYYP